MKPSPAVQMLVGVIRPPLIGSLGLMILTGGSAGAATIIAYCTTCTLVAAIALAMAAPLRADDQAAMR